MTFSSQRRGTLPGREGFPVGYVDGGRVGVQADEMSTPISCGNLMCRKTGPVAGVM